MSDTAGDRSDGGADGRLNGADLISMFRAAADALEINAEPINALNVFPVPDGDTGTNMLLTLRSGFDKLDGNRGMTAAKAGADYHSGVLRGARGNSGVILSRFIKGFEVGLEGVSDFGPAELARVCEAARKWAYESVSEPVEGTMLTVITSVAQAARSAADADENILTALSVMSDSAADTVSRTPDMMPMLREAGVVDAGGQGLAVVVEAMRRSVAGEDVSGAPYDVQIPDSRLEEYLKKRENDVLGYCTQFNVEADGLDLEALRVKMNEIATSTSIISEGSTTRVHGHLEDPGKLISVGVSFGAISEVKADNMDAQRDEFAAGGKHQDEPEAVMDKGDGSIIVVANGEGIREAFLGLRDTWFVAGGDTMNPSVGDLLDKIEASTAETVYLLPNNKNIIPAAKQAAEQSDKSVHVVETRTIPQGLAALFGPIFDPDTPPEENVRVMNEQASDVTSGGVTRAERDTNIDGVDMREGQYMGLLDGKILVACDELDDALCGLLDKAGLEDDGIVALFWGDDLTEERAAAAAERVRRQHDGVAVDLHHGGQPLYPFIISIE